MGVSKLWRERWPFGRWRRPDEADGESGQAMVEYGIISVMIFGGVVLSWPFTVQLLEALDGYYNAIYWVIRSPIP